MAQNGLKLYRHVVRELRKLAVGARDGLRLLVGVALVGAGGGAGVGLLTVVLMVLLVAVLLLVVLVQVAVLGAAPSLGKGGGAACAPTAVPSALGGLLGIQLSMADPRAPSSAACQRALAASSVLRPPICLAAFVVRSTE